MNEIEFKEKLKSHNRVTQVINYGGRLHSLVDLETQRIVCVTNNTSTTRALSTLINVHEFSSCNKRIANEWDKTITQENCIYWGWFDRYKTRTPTAQNFNKFEEYYRCMLLNEKGSALDRIHIEIALIRNQQYNDMFLQDDIYTQKYIEATTYLATKNAKNTLFLNSYADMKNITLDQAAEQIINMRMFHLSYLNETETLRMKYTNLILDQTDFFEIQQVVSNFIKEAYEYGIL
jgi:hypothetical protein